MRASLSLIASLSLLVAAPALAQQINDPNFHPKVADPAWTAGTGPVVAVDQAHNNFHTLGTGYKPFGELLTADGYRPRPSTLPFDAPDALKGVDILVVVNARGKANPAAPAFTDSEIAVLGNWVENGGALLLIADHAPFGAAAEALANRFGVDMGKGFVVEPPYNMERSPAFLDFSGKELGAHAILTGRSPAEAIHMVKTYTGQSLAGPSGSTGLLDLPDVALEVADFPAIKALREGQKVPGIAVGGRSQALAMPYGKGRLVVAGDAAFFTAQVIMAKGVPMLVFGMNAPGSDDQQFVLNTAHWLSRLLDANKVEVPTPVTAPPPVPAPEPTPAPTPPAP